MKTILLLRFFLCISFLFSTTYTYTQDAGIEKTIGGTGYDAGHMISCTDDGGFLITGQTKSYGDSLGDTYVIKLDAWGNQEWVRNTGGNHLEGGNSIIPLTNGEYVVICHTESYGSGLCDGWVYRCDKAGNILWSTMYGDILDDVAEDGFQSPDGNFVVTGLSQVADASGDGYIAKYDKITGNQIWSKTYGVSGHEQAKRIVPSADGGYIVAGTTSVNANGSEDIWVFKTDASGKLIWSHNFGGSGIEEAYGLCAAPGGGYVIAGLTNSYGNGDEDAYLVKIDEEGNELWSKNYGGLLLDRARSVTTTSDGVYMITGYTFSYADPHGDVMIIKTDKDGNQLWLKTIGGAEFDEGKWIVRCPDGNFAICGSTRSKGNGDADVYFVKINSEGNITTKVKEIIPYILNLQVYPNPASDMINFKSGNVDETANSSLVIYNTLGEKLLEYKISVPVVDKSFDVSKWTNGLYVYRLLSNTNTLSEGKFNVVR